MRVYMYIWTYIRQLDAVYFYKKSIQVYSYKSHQLIMIYMVHSWLLFLNLSLYLLNPGINNVIVDLLSQTRFIATSAELVQKQ